MRFARDGRIRVPDFQRGLKWDATDVTTLFDSIYRGLPIGSLLMWKRPAPAGRLSFGPLSIHAPQTAEGWWVVDGQQRMTTLAAALLRSLPLPLEASKHDPFVVFFDSTLGTFETPRGSAPPHWVPVPAMFDATELSEWVHDWELGQDRTRRQRVFSAGSRLREYRVPLYLVESDDKAVLEEIFARINTTGKRLEWSDVHDALYGRRGTSPSTTTELSERLREQGMGRLDEQTILKCLIAMRGLDPTRTIDDHRAQQPNALDGAASDALPVLERVLSFLAQQCEIPHLRLLPRKFVLEPLTRFFALHPEPAERTITLLTRWLWRVLVGASKMDERTLERRAVAAISSDEALSIPALLALVPAEAPPEIELATAFDARTAGSRLAMLALASLKPRDLHTGASLDVAALLEERESEAFGSIAKGSAGPENRLFSASGGTARRSLIELCDERDAILRSHAIEPADWPLLQNNVAEFLNRRRAVMHQRLQTFASRLASWGRDHDRPAIGDLLSRVS